MEQENLQQAEELNNNEPISPDTLNDETQKRFQFRVNLHR